MTLRGQKNHYNVKFLKGYGHSISVKNSKIVLKDCHDPFSEPEKEEWFVKKIRLTLDKVNYYFIRLMSFTDCPHCSNQGFVMPLVKEENRYICSMCGSVYQVKEN